MLLLATAPRPASTNTCAAPPRSPCAALQAVLVHQLSKGATQNPFRRNRGRVVRVLFHPAKPFFFVATQQNVSRSGDRWGAAVMAAVTDAQTSST